MTTRASLTARKHHTGAIPAVHLWFYKIRHRAILIAQPHQCLLPRGVPRPPKLLQSTDRILSKSNPSLLHHIRETFLRSSSSNTTDILRVPKQHLHFCTMVCATSRVKAGIRPVPEVAVLPDRYVVGFASAGFEVVGTCEGFEQELVALRLRGVDASPVGRDHVVALLVVVVAEELGLRGVWLGIAGMSV
jgi:hypothetical protein